MLKNKTKRIVLHLPPIAQARPRFVKATGRAYNPQETEAGKVIIFLRNEVFHVYPDDTAFTVDICADFKRPKSHYGTGKNAGMLKKSAPKFCLNTKDVDNIAKFYLDVLTEMAWADDRQVVNLCVKKRWCSENKITILITALG